MSSTVFHPLSFHPICNFLSQPKPNVPLLSINLLLGRTADSQFHMEGIAIYISSMHIELCRAAWYKPSYSGTVQQRANRLPIKLPSIASRVFSVRQNFRGIIFPLVVRWEIQKGGCSLPVLEPDRLYLELTFLMMFSWIWYHSLSVVHLEHEGKTLCVMHDLGQRENTSPITFLNFII